MSRPLNCAPPRQDEARHYVSEGTVKNHISNILTRLGVRDRTQAAIYALDHGLA
ncbi:response regulator transcription factor [Nocardia niigatensis]|uniref:response regulator transcription factor n=1 Tax=Nocardia niigatensis TaxID=209249 RepID=UPI002479B005